MFLCRYREASLSSGNCFSCLYYGKLSQEITKFNTDHKVKISHAEEYAYGHSMQKSFPLLKSKY